MRGGVSRGVGRAHGSTRGPISINLGNYWGFPIIDQTTRRVGYGGVFNLRIMAAAASLID